MRATWLAVLVVAGVVRCGHGSTEDDAGGDREYDSLKLRVQVDRASICVRGTTDVPSGSRVTVELHSLETMRTAFVDTVRVRDGVFVVKVGAGEGDEGFEGPHRVTAMVSPGRQPPAIRRRIGGHGERLVGDAVRDDGGVRFLVADEVLDIPGTGTGSPALPPLSTVDPGEPEGIALELIYAWKARRWRMIEELAGPGWTEEGGTGGVEGLKTYRPLSAHHVEIQRPVAEAARLTVHSLVRDDRSGSERYALIQLELLWAGGRWRLDRSRGLTVQL